jgi:O-methyltransferase
MRAIHPIVDGAGPRAGPIHLSRSSALDADRDADVGRSHGSIRSDGARFRDRTTAPKADLQRQHSSIRSAITRRLPPGVTKALKVLFQPSRTVVLPYPPAYQEDGFATIHNCDFIHDAEFKRAYAAGERTGSWSGNRWRAHVYAWVASQAFRLQGDFVECGVNKGGYARMLYEYLPLAQSPRKFFLMDTFNGFDGASITQAERERGIPDAYRYTECFEQVRETFAPFLNAVLVRGAIPSTLTQVTSQQVAFLSIDMNCVEPEITAAEYFWDRMVPGGFILLDDYGHPLHIAQKRAFDGFARAHGVKILQLPTEQALIMRP